MVDQFIASQSKSPEGMKAEVATYGLLPGAMEAMKLQLQTESIARANNTAITAAQQVQLDLLKQKTSEYAMTLAGLQTIQANLTPSESYLQEPKIQAQFNANTISAQQFLDAQQRLAENAQSTWNTAGASMAGEFAQLSQEFGKHSMAMATAAKGSTLTFGIVEARINTYTAFTKALASAVPPFNDALAAGVLAAGMAKVAAISSMSIPSFSTGGFVSGAGTSVSDSIPAMLSNGEFVVNAEATQRNRREIAQQSGSRQFHARFAGS
ncbi:hypothetical protein [Bradyrhizobium diazoefficiens]|uniref:hypothetical protein n=1 Tax=Bradyrhizobium diazoefficiens TaxID=1355477 RepID=UPI00351519B8